jgi:endonuclease YncB( thermonuclease family)
MYTYKATLLNVVNGNTVDAEIDLGFSVKLRQRVRLFGVDILPGKEDEAKTKLSDLLPREFVVETILNKRGKYGRVMGKAFVQTDEELIDINQLMVSQGVAQRYNGK